MAAGETARHTGLAVLEMELHTIVAGMMARRTAEMGVRHTVQAEGEERRTVQLEHRTVLVAVVERYRAVAGDAADRSIPLVVAHNPAGQAEEVCMAVDHTALAARRTDRVEGRRTVVADTGCTLWSSE